MIKKFVAAALVFLLAVSLAACIKIESADDYYGNAGGTPDSGESVLLSIECGTVLDNWEDLDPALRDEKYVPSDGVILAKTEYAIEEGDTVFDVLSRAVRENKIQMECRGANANAFGSVYIEGINYLYEFSCGPLSGWMYKVNGAFPNYGCGMYQLKDGDVVEWVYTCDLGRDVGIDWEM